MRSQSVSSVRSFQFSFVFCFRARDRPNTLAAFEFPSVVRISFFIVNLFLLPLVLLLDDDETETETADCLLSTAEMKLPFPLTLSSKKELKNIFVEKFKDLNN